MQGSAKPFPLHGPFALPTASYGYNDIPILFIHTRPVPVCSWVDALWVIITYHYSTFSITTDAINIKSRLPKALYMGIVGDSSIFWFEKALSWDLNTNLF